MKVVPEQNRQHFLDIKHKQIIAQTNKQTQRNIARE